MICFVFLAVVTMLLASGCSWPPEGTKHQYKSQRIYHNRRISLQDEPLKDSVHNYTMSNFDSAELKIEILTICRPRFDVLQSLQVFLKPLLF